MRTFLSLLLLFASLTISAQKKILDHADVEIWNSIKNKAISSDGNFIMYALEKGEQDQFLKIKDANANLIFEHHRGEEGKFTHNAKFAIFTVKPFKDSIRALQRKKIDKEKLPKDTLGIYNLKDKSLLKIANMKSYKIPEKWEGYVAYLLDEAKVDKKKKPENKAADSIKPKTVKKIKKVGKDTGYHLVIRNLNSGKQDTVKFVKDFIFAKEGKRLAYTTSGVDSTSGEGVYVIDLESNKISNIFKGDKAKYAQLSFSDSGKNLGFIVDVDTTKVQVRPNELYIWHDGNKLAKKQVDNTTAPKNYLVSADGKITFSKDETKLYFGLAKPPIVKDTMLLAEEIVNVEVWTYNEPQLYTVQELQLKNDLKKSFETVIHLNNNKLYQLATVEFPEAEIGNEGNAMFALVNASMPYELESQWTGQNARDYSVVNINTGETTEILKNIAGRVMLSPNGKYAYGYNPIDREWFTVNLASKKVKKLTSGKVFYDELNDSPDHPNSYGLAGWIANDAAIIIYDRYDIWEFNPENGQSRKLTNGRVGKTVFRYAKMDDEERFISTDKDWLLTNFNEINKHSGYYKLNFKTLKGEQLLMEPYSYSTPVKARDSEKVIFTRESFTEFPNILYSDLNFKKPVVISNANPQQSDYNWGTAELINWISLDGIELTGMLIKPENFDPNKKYPLLVNFYEKSSDDLNNHRAPAYGRSSINYSFYASRGYVIFNPDIQYRIGYPGESAFNCVIPGVTSLIEKGFIDKDNIGVQGHSWGGYQIAYLVTKTNIFKAAESGAPVANMISAYGGIRWWTGLSRQFQYEHTQSRIGGTPWEYPARYTENSPIFNMDKINTPLLIMHNDADGHVPWYQGIEFFTALRRLGKPSWFLNYNEEPHWPVKYQNRKDFNIRMAQFFDYYLKGDLKPVWMDRGVPAIEKGINQGLELIQVKTQH
ncbi:MAG: prolyl oligopeptidase family serine peptidase [Lutibacter sp.]|nr:prolyl oligopeptidase family serine peptidase [Lutibacter sp.]